MRPFLVLLLASCVGETTTGPAGEPGAGEEGAEEEGAGSGGMEPETPPEEPPPAPRQAWIIDTGGTGLNLRAAAGTGAEVLSVMPEHAVLDVMAGPEGADGQWWQVRYGDRVGWAHGGFLEMFEPGASIPEDGGWNFLLPWEAGRTFRVTQGHESGSHTGNGAWAWDFGMPRGTPVVATHGGVVRRMKGGETAGGCDPSYAASANFVVIDRGDGLESLYLHLDTVAVSQGETVLRGQVIGTSGQTGWACGAHLHFQIQLSPSGGGGESGYNPSVPQFFWDSGAPVDPPLQAEPVSQNDTGAVP